MKIRKLDAQGVTHYVALIAVVSVAVMAGVFITVLNSSHHSKTKSNLTSASKNAQKKEALSANDKSQSALSAATETSASSTQPTATPTQARASSAAATKSGTSSTTAGPTSTSPTPAPSQSPLSVLTALISNLDSGAQINITASAVTVPGPITNAQARPIVFSANGQVYFAYRQGSAPSFTVSPSQTASTMAIVNATVSNPSLVQAHLDKAANLVDPNISSYLVAYSLGGN